MRNNRSQQLVSARHAAAVLAFVSVIPVVSSCRTNLSRTRAMDIIRAAPEFNRPKTSYVQTGMNVSFFAYQPEPRALIDLGLMEIHGTPKQESFMIKDVDFVLTRAGLLESTNWKREDHGDTTFWTFLTANRRLLAVTGIRSLEAGTSQVEFTWSWLANKLGEAINRSAAAATEARRGDRALGEQEYEAQFSRTPVDPLWRMQLDRMHNQQVDRMDSLFATVMGAARVDTSKVFRAVTDFYRYDDGWHPTSKSGQDLTAALDKSETQH